MGCCNSRSFAGNRSGNLPRARLHVGRQTQINSNGDQDIRKLLLSFAVCVPLAAHAATTKEVVCGTYQATVSVCFTPGGKCDLRIVDAIDAAQKEIRVQAYVFTAPNILLALADARKRGVDVRVILDETNDPKNPTTASSYTGVTFALNNKILVVIDDKPAIAHNKVIIIDGHLVIGGSYNYTKSAQNANAENVTFVESSKVAECFHRNWEARAQVSRPVLAH